MNDNQDDADDLAKPEPVKAKPAAPAAKARPGIVRRGSSKPKPAPEPEPEDDDEDDEEEAFTPRGEPSGMMKPVHAWIARMKTEPKILTLTIVIGISIILLFAGLIGWYTASSRAYELKQALSTDEEKLRKLNDEHQQVKLELGAKSDALKSATDKLDKADAQQKELLAAKTDADQKCKIAEKERDDNLDKRRKAEDDYDTTFKKLKESETKRDEDYRRRQDAEKAYAEEARLRKELQAKIEDLNKQIKDLRGSR